MRAVKKGHVKVHSSIVHILFCLLSYALQIGLAATLLLYFFIDSVFLDKVPLMLCGLHDVRFVAALRSMIYLALNRDGRLLIHHVRRLLDYWTWNLEISYAILF
jgi:hypothetical protein